jgi:hypothetical protein
LYVYSCLNEDEFDDWKEITEEEQQHFDKYLECQKAEAKVNIGGELYTYEINVCCRRICKLIELNAPQIVVNQEKKLLAMFLTINKIAKAI